MTNATHPPTPGAFLVAYRQTRNRLTTQPDLFQAEENVISVTEYLERHPDEEHWTNVRDRLQARHRHPSQQEHS